MYFMKVISRMIVNCLNEVLCEVMSSNQASFVPRRQSCDNFVILSRDSAFDEVHYYETWMHGTKTRP